MELISPTFFLSHYSFIFPFSFRFSSFSLILISSRSTLIGNSNLTSFMYETNKLPQMKPNQHLLQMNLARAPQTKPRGE